MAVGFRARRAAPRALLASGITLAALLLACAAPAAHAAARPRRAGMRGADAPAGGPMFGALSEREQVAASAGASNSRASANAEASMQVAARQPLFDYAVAQGLAILNATVQHTTIPEVNATVEVPLIGGIDVSVRDVNVTTLQVDPALARVAIEAGFYHAAAANVTANITFGWSWSKGPLGGSGEGELFLEGGAVDMIFLVRNQEGGAPQLVPVSSGVAFQGLELTVHAASADWLYQALLYVFKGAVRRQIEGAMDDALRETVPSAINDLLGALPSSLDIQGLPFRAVFTYAVYTLSYVMVKGFAEVDAPDPAPSVAARLAAALAPGAPSSAAAAAASAGAACPFPSTPLPLVPVDIGREGRMVSVYAHESVLNCVAWGLFRAGALKTSVKDGDLPGLRLITDVFGALMPELPKAYPRHGIGFDVSLDAPPAVLFGSAGVAPSAAAWPRAGGVAAGAAAESGGGGSGFAAAGVGGGPQGDDVQVSLSYTTVVSVLNASADGSGAPLQVARLAANLSVTADFGWAATAIKSVNVSYAPLDYASPVNPDGWNKAIDWVVRQAGAKLALKQVWEDYVRAPAAPFFSLENVVTGSAGDAWRGLSADVRVAAAPGGGGGGGGGARVPAAAGGGARVPEAAGAWVQT